ncbi:flocculation protein FLO11-like [Anopheles albimanus]|uniref:UBA domain-containing protein n=1 Tax=Anopheles albimanus TaxID=7167 RepID=A0A182FSZ0_ANOAL|nr:flocculation protein FLO11-like [Anopheles albimanus]
MSHHGSPPSQMDGVPVKISERFKPPPKLVLPQGVVNRLSQYDIDQVLRDSCYGGELEETVLKRMAEWRAIKQREREERNNRLRLVEQNRLRQIEAEQKQKLHQISYPNTDELSSASDDDDGDEKVGREVNGEPCPTSGANDRKKTKPEDEQEDSEEEENDESAPSGSSDERAVKPYDHTERQLCSILVPTVIREPAPIAADALTPASLTIIPKTTTAPAVAVCMSSNEATVATSTAFIGCNNNNNNNNYNKINYSDFENDTSSPFDNMELRTINDLDILAQVLKLNTNLSSPTGATGPPKEEKEVAPTPIKREADPLPEQQPPPPPPSHQHHHQQQLPALHSNSAYNSSPYSVPTQQYSMQHAGFPPTNQYHQPPQTSISGAGVNDYLRTSYANYHQSPQPYATIGYGSGYASSTTTAASESLYSMSNYSGPSPYNVPVSQQAAAYQPVAYGYNYSHQYAPATNVVPSTSVAASTATHTYAPNYGYSTATVPTYHGYQQSSSSSSGCTPTNPSANYHTTSTTSIGHHDATVSHEGTTTSGGVSGLRSKSRSVPDILRQLNDELQDSVARRTRNNSQTISDRHAPDVQGEEAAVAADEKRIDYTKYNQLSQAEQNLVKRISSMGFPLERVVWVLQRIGNDDKKVIEHLIPLSELLDVGFEEEKISDALLKFGNNKHKALDYLIS